MRGDIIAKLALGGAGLCSVGSLAGLGLANYVESGSFHFYRQARVAAWQPAPDPPRFKSSDIAFASIEPTTDAGAAAQPQYATFDR